MSVNQIGNALGSWDISLSPDTPRDVLDALLEFGRIVVLPGRLDPVQYGDNLLTAARYVGVLRVKEFHPDGAVTLSGVSMVVWLGDEDGKGQVLEDAVTAASGTFANAVNAVLPDSVTAGTIYSVPGTASYTIQWKSPRQALDQICDLYGTPTYPVEYRVNGNATVDAGRVQDLYGTDPKTIVVAKEAGYDLDLLALPGQFGSKRDVEDYTTRTVALSQGEGEAISTAAVDQADIGAANPYLDPFGNPVRFTRLIDASDTDPSQLGTVATLQLGRFQGTRDELTLSTAEYDISGDVSAGDYIWAYDPDAGLYDTANEIVFRGQRLNPIKLRVLETTWPVVQGMTVAFRHGDGTWIDLTDYVDFETAGETSLKVAGFDRSLISSTTTPPGDRVNGDTSVPATPVFGAFVGTTYQANGDETKAQIVVTWTQPLNTDGSTIVDGDHYEIRYRPNVTAPYAATWNEASQDTWNELHTWNQPRVAPITNTDWQTVFAPWDSNSYRVQELTPSVIYEFQIRAVDTASPPNKSQWSATQAFEAPRDTMPPSTPAAPLVVGSLIAIQVVHLLGTAAGGTFNLESDTNHLEVHVSNNETFQPDETTLVGRLVCGAALQSGVPVVGTFPVEETDERYVKVVAVDRSGNKSNPSDATPATPKLIDDEHISNLTVSKVTAGTITADWLLAAAIKTAASGQRLELNAEGLQAYGEEGDQTINLSSDPASTGNYITFQQDGVALASISEDGNISGQDFNVVGDLVINGDDFRTDLYDPLPKGEVARGQGTNVVTGAGVNTEKGYVEIGFTAEAGRRYRITFSGFISSNVSADNATLTLRDGGTAAPTLSSTLLRSAVFPTGLLDTALTATMIHEAEFTAGLHRLLIGFKATYGTATMRGNISPYQLFIDDAGPSLPSMSQLNDGGGGAAPVPQTYTKTYTATWHGSYKVDGSLNSFFPTQVIQGYYDGTNGNQRGLIGFNNTQIQSDLAGATITSVKLTLNAEHWYWNSGGTAVIGTHNYASKPSTWAAARVTQNRLTSANWPKPGKRTVTLSNTIGNEFKAGTSTGIALGPGPSNDWLYYGKFTGSGGGSNAPVLTIQYTK
ncbi:fibronectin type III domain-containing protein [Streptomyces sp. NPDC056291]|uniref:fibronectin type III domain-containing protein n=1 Tax=Streptomyces sp. NPDC056291 TaxID=3345772 RepID=UPI0035DF73D6